MNKWVLRAVAGMVRTMDATQLFTMLEDVIREQGHDPLPIYRELYFALEARIRSLEHPVITEEQ